jgi:hypothetical protein
MAQRVSYSQVRSVFDGLDQTAFLLNLGTIPGAGSDRFLAIKCMNVPVPGMSNEAYEAAVHGHVVRFRGRKVQSRQLTVTYYEDQNAATLITLRKWHEWVVGTESGNSQAYKSGYSIRPQLVIFDHVGRPIDEIRFDGFFIQEISDFTMDGGSSALVQVQATFSYDEAHSLRVART